MNVTALPRRRNASLAFREALGDATHATSRRVQACVAYLAQPSDGAPIRAHLAVDGACRASATRGLSGQYARLSVARGFLRHRNARLPESEVPARQLRAAPRRPYPSLCSATAINRVLDGAGRFSPRESLRPWTPQTWFGLWACPRRRPRAARNLLVPAVQRDEQPPRLWIRAPKWHTSRWGPLHPTAAAPLRCDAHRRHVLQDDGLSEVFCLSEPGAISPPCTAPSRG